MPGAGGPLGFPQAAALQLRFHLGQQLFNRQFLQKLRVEPLQLGPIENAIRPADPGQRKFLDQFRGAQEFLVATWRPSE
jgi:hypothetical protein